jgi:hypothetical protein
MGIQVQNITDEPHQRHVILIDDAEVTVVLRFYPTVQIWCVDVDAAGRTASGFKLSLGVLHMVSQNFPFDFVVQDTSGTGLDPFKLDDFSTGRCALYMLDAADMEAVRDAPVPV